MNEVWICGIPYRIVEKETVDENGGCLGQILYRDCVIEIRKGLPKELYTQTLIHEIVHGMLSNIGKNDLADNEEFVQALAMAINLTFRLRDKDGNS